MPRQNCLQVQHSFSPETLAQIADLAKRWGGVASLPKSQVIREAIRRCWLAEQNKLNASTYEATMEVLERPEPIVKTKNGKKKP
jgi:hypothetical protein